MVIKMDEKECIEELINGLNMGIIAIEHLVDKIEDLKLKDIVNGQKKTYQDLKEHILKSYPQTEDQVKQKLMLESMIELKTVLTDDSKIAKMLTEGSNQAVMTMTHLLNKEEHVDRVLKGYADDFEDISKKYIECLKPFL